MRLSRVSAVLAVALCVGLPALVAQTSCQGATQIIVELRTDGCGQITSTDVTTATTEAGLAGKKADATQGGCTTPPQVGKAVLVPDGDSDADVFIRAVAGIGKPASACTLPADPDCVIVQRRSKFSSTETVNVVIDLNVGCRGVTCAPEQTCDPATKACVGTGAPGADSGPQAVSDAAPDTSTVADTGGDGGPCNGAGCTFECTAANCKPACIRGLPCTINCRVANACRDVTCGGAKNCTVNCFVEDACMGTTRCGEKTMDTCNVNCKTAGACGGNIACMECPDSDRGRCDVVCEATDCENRTVDCCSRIDCRIDNDIRF